MTLSSNGKTCARCGKSKPLGEFHKQKAAKSGRGSYCKLCVRDYDREWGTPEKRRYKRVKTLYGLSKEEYDDLVQRAGGKCELCGRKSKKLVLDHSHKTGDIRGMIHDNCNFFISIIKDDPEKLEMAIAYLRREPFKRSSARKWAIDNRRTWIQRRKRPWQ